MVAAAVIVVVVKVWQCAVIATATIADKWFSKSLFYSL
jgi:hypothetical protein